MNYLAHAYLSFNQPDIVTGNMISDFVKGKKKFDFTSNVQKGIALHRAIDEFTDFHPVTQVAKEYFRKNYRLYSGAFVDVLYDHFLANDPDEFADKAELSSFCQSTYNILQSNTTGMPVKFLQMLPLMQQHNWLYNYRSREGIEKSFGGLVRRAAYLYESAIAYSIFNERYAELRECYQSFFPALKNFSLNYLNELNTK
ncbi:MAG: ACP phosphodiesterase [Ferruginibacter sp.]